MPIGAGGVSGPNCQASPPSPSGTTLGALSWNFRGMYCFQRCGGSRMCESAEIRWYARAIACCPPARGHTNKRSFVSRGRATGARWGLVQTLVVGQLLALEEGHVLGRQPVLPRPLDEQAQVARRGLPPRDRPRRSVGERRDALLPVDHD